MYAVPNNTVVQLYEARSQDLFSKMLHSSIFYILLNIKKNIKKIIINLKIILFVGLLFIKFK
jgi:hypothetical protein